MEVFYSLIIYVKLSPPNILFTYLLLTYYKYHRTDFYKLCIRYHSNKTNTSMLLEKKFKDFYLPKFLELLFRNFFDESVGFSSFLLRPWAPFEGFPLSFFKPLAFWLELAVRIIPSSVIGAITVPIFVTTFGALSLRAAVSGIKVDVIGARIADSKAAVDRKERGKSLT